MKARTRRALTRAPQPTTAALPPRTREQRIRVTAAEMLPKSTRLITDWKAKNGELLTDAERAWLARSEEKAKERKRKNDRRKKP